MALLALTSMAAPLVVSSALAGTAGAAPRPESVTAVQPSRVLDTRFGIGAPTGRINPGTVVPVAVPAASSVGALTVTVNITATDAAGAGYVRAWPCGEAQPSTSVLNFTSSRTVANAAVVKLGQGQVCVATSAPVNLIIDLVGWATGTIDVTGINPARLLDTRSSGDPLSAGAERRLKVAGRSGIGGNAQNAVLTLTVDDPDRAGWVVAYPCGQPTNGSTVNFQAHETTANTTIVGLSGGDVCLKSFIGTDLIVDAYGWSAGAGDMKIQAPTRILDTRDSSAWSFGPAKSTSKIQLRVAGRGGVPTNAASALLTVTVADARGDGYVTVWPCDQDIPNASTLNTYTGALKSNLALVELTATDGTACIQYTSSNRTSTSLIVDAIGWIAGGPERGALPTTPIAPAEPVIPPAPESEGGSIPNTGGCILALAQQPATMAFCETFDRPAGVAGTRTGDLNPTLWGVSRTNTYVNIGQQQYSWWFKASGVPGCDIGTAPNDVRICNGRVIEAVNDGHESKTNLSMYPKQPFDIAGRTGTVSFDVSADSQGPHAAWPEFWWTDQPVPTPHGDTEGYNASARNSFGFAIAGCNGDSSRTGITMIAITRNYATQNLGPIEQLGCVLKGSATGALNHFEVRINANGAEIWATDAGQTQLKLLARTSVSMPLSRGVIWLEDLHYNACKFDSQCDHAFAWDNVAFDGPKLYRDLTFDVPDANTPVSNGVTSLGYRVGQSPVSVQVQGVNWVHTPATAYVTLNWAPNDTTVPMVRINGGPWHSTAWPYANFPPFWKSIAIPIPLSEIRTGTNTIEFQQPGGAQDTVICNINLTLINAAPVP